MMYIIEKISIWESDGYFWNSKCTPDDRVIHKSTEEFKTNSLDMCIDILKNEIDPVDYELNSDNIKHIFGNDLSDTSINQVINYHSYRNKIFHNLMVWINDMKNKGGEYYFDIPYDYNHYELRETDNFYEKQIDYSFKIKIEKD